MKWPAAIVTVIIVTLLVGAAENALVALYFAAPPRMTTNFSPALLRRELTSLGASPRPVVLFGDSVLWGYRLAAEQTAASLLISRGTPARNLAFKAGSPANYYALTRLLISSGINPQCVVLEINQKTFNQADAAYQTLHPAVASLAYPLLAPSDRALLALERPPAGFGTRVQRAVSSIWLPYALRTDVRDALFGENDAPGEAQTTPEAFEGTYDLAPLGPDNVAVHFLVETARSLRDARIPVLAFMTPTNHALLHDYIDNKQYRANGTYLKTLLRRYGARVLDLDTSLPRSDFLDNDHLTALGQRRLADALQPALAHGLAERAVHLANDR